MQFRLRTLFLLLVAIGSAVAAFGLWGILVVIVCVAVVTALHVSFARAGRVTCIEIAVLFFGSLFVIAHFLPSFEAARTTESVCEGNLGNIVRALLRYHEFHGCFPPAYVTDANGKPMHSWRVLILPYLRYNPENDQLYKMYDFTEPWDGPNNRKLACKMPPVYQCPSTKRDDRTTSYVVVTGPGTAWSADKSSTIDDLSDGTSSTILVVEIPTSDIQWMEPRDLSLDDVLSTDLQSWQNSPSHHSKKEGYFVTREWTGRHVAMANGWVLRLTQPFPQNLQALFTIADGVGPVEFDPLHQGQPVTIIHWGHCVGLTTFIISMILLLSQPLPKKWIEPAAKENNDSQNGDES